MRAIKRWASSCLRTLSERACILPDATLFSCRLYLFRLQTNTRLCMQEYQLVFKRTANFRFFKSFDNTM